MAGVDKEKPRRHYSLRQLRKGWSGRISRDLFRNNQTSDQRSQLRTFELHQLYLGVRANRWINRRGDRSGRTGTGNWKNFKGDRRNRVSTSWDSPPFGRNLWPGPMYSVTETTFRGSSD